MEGPEDMMKIYTFIAMFADYNDLLWTDVRKTSRKTCEKRGQFVEIKCEIYLVLGYFWWKNLWTDGLG